MFELPFNGERLVRDTRVRLYHGLVVAVVLARRLRGLPTHLPVSLRLAFLRDEAGALRDLEERILLLKLVVVAFEVR